MNKINQALILAAGRGERLMPYTKDTPKPLMKIGQETLLERQLIQLKKSGIKYVTIHTSYLGEKIIKLIGSGERFGLEINYAHSDMLLGPGGGIVFSRKYLKNPDNEFLLLNGDVFTDYDYSKLLAIDGKKIALKMVFIDNPKHNPDGDFCLENGIVSRKKDKKLTYSGITVISPMLFKRENIEQVKSFIVLIEPFIIDKLVRGEYYSGQWDDIGSPERLKEIQKNA